MAASSVDPDRQWKLDVVKFVLDNIISRVVNIGDISREEAKTRCLEYIGPDKNQPGAPSRIGIWWESFTDPTVIESDVNYEKLETIGDQILDASMIRELQNAFPHATSHEMDKLMSHYTSNEIFAQIVDDVFGESLVRLIKVNPAIKSIGYEIKADVFEAIFGAMHTISESIHPDLGMVNCGNLLRSILADWFAKTNSKFDKKRMKNPAKSELAELFSILGRRDLPARGETAVWMGAVYKVTFTITPEMIEVLNDKNREINPSAAEFVFEETQFTEQNYRDTIATENAYSRVMRAFEAQGINLDWAKQIKYHNTIATLNEDVKRALDIEMRRRGYTAINFIKVKKHRTLDGEDANILTMMRKDGTWERVEVGVWNPKVIRENIIRKWLGMPPVVYQGSKEAVAKRKVLGFKAARQIGQEGEVSSGRERRGDTRRRSTRI